jgi:hypothetical protein
MIYSNLSWCGGDGCTRGPERRLGEKIPLFCCFRRGVVPASRFCPSSARLTVIKSAKAGLCLFPKRGCVDTYPSHPTASPGSPSQEAFTRDRSAPKALIGFVSGPAFRKAMQRFNAGWSSPVARQAHNLKVIGSNPIPATKYAKLPWRKLREFRFCWARNLYPAQDRARSAIRRRFDLAMFGPWGDKAAKSMAASARSSSRFLASVKRDFPGLRLRQGVGPENGRIAMP